MAALIRNLLNDTRGTTAIEYAVVASLMGVAAAIGGSVLGGDIAAMYRDFGNEISAALSAGGSPDAPPSGS